MTVFFELFADSVPPFAPIVGDDVRNENLLDLGCCRRAVKALQDKLDQVDMIEGGHLAEALEVFADISIIMCYSCCGGLKMFSIALFAVANPCDSPSSTILHDWDALFAGHHGDTFTVLLFPEEKVGRRVHGRHHVPTRGIAFGSRG